jgi:pantetheine-phosphate adenylyltransferase
MKKALFPGSFDPFHNGHKNIYLKAQKLFDEVIIFVANNNAKENQSYFTTRVKIIKKELPNAKVIFGNHLTAYLAKKHNCEYLVRGIRNTEDILYEEEMAKINNYLNKELTTILLFADEDLKNISSTSIKIGQEFQEDLKKLGIKINSF